MRCSCVYACLRDAVVTACPLIFDRSLFAAVLLGKHAEAHGCAVGAATAAPCISALFCAASHDSALALWISTSQCGQCRTRSPPIVCKSVPPARSYAQRQDCWRLGAGCCQLLWRRRSRQRGPWQHLQKRWRPARVVTVCAEPQRKRAQPCQAGCERTWCVSAACSSGTVC